MDRQAQRDIRRKLNCLIFAQEQGNNVLACRKFGVSRSSFYRWKACYRDQGEDDLLSDRLSRWNIEEMTTLAFRVQ